MNEEIWKPIKGLEGFYEVSNFARVKSLTRMVKRSHTVYYNVKGCMMKPYTDNRGYKTIILVDAQGKIHRCKVHRLVAEAFIPNPEHKPYIDHKDGNTANNHVYLNTDGSVDYDRTNIRWCTQKENLNNPRTKKLMSVSQKRAFKNGKEKHYKEVHKYTMDGYYVETFKSVDDAARNTGVVPTSIGNAIHGRSCSSGGFRWSTQKVDKLEPRN